MYKNLTKNPIFSKNTAEIKYKSQDQKVLLFQCYITYVNITDIGSHMKTLLKNLDGPLFFGLRWY